MFRLQARSLETKQLWVKELREVIQQFQFGTLRERSKTVQLTFRIQQLMRGYWTILLRPWANANRIAVAQGFG